jgi:hypothetical protein|tara:strand:- start:857 stop:1003 length:147 start_codon:yes stop_codon:yes gene_type:complete
MNIGAGIGIGFQEPKGAPSPSPTDLILLEDGVFFITLENNTGLIALEN